MTYQQKPAPESIEIIFARGLLALKILTLVNGIVVALVLLFWITTFPSWATKTALVFFTIEFLFFVLWFIPCLVFHVAIRKRGLREAASRSLWSVVDAISYAAPG